MIIQAIPIKWYEPREYHTILFSSSGLGKNMDWKIMQYKNFALCHSDIFPQVLLKVIFKTNKE